MRRVLVLLVLTILGLVGCGGESAERDGAAGATDAGGTFPVTVEHRYGKTTVESEPKRIVVVGLTEQDIVYELGYEPVGVTEWYGDQPNATWPWAREAAGDAKPTVLETTNGFDYEAIAALRPDLIIGTNAGIKQGDYDKLSRLAPTVAGVSGGTDYFSPWDKQTELVAAALGKADEGKRIVADIEAAYAKAGEEHPDFAGKTATFSQGGFSDGLIYVYYEGLNTEFLTMLGFTMNPKVEPLAKPGEQALVPEEKVDLIDADAIVFAGEKPSDVANLFKVPTFDQVGAVKDNRAVYTDATLSGAIYFMTPLSLRYVLDRLPDQLQLALDGKAPRRLVPGD